MDSSFLLGVGLRSRDWPFITTCLLLSLGYCWRLCYWCKFLHLPTRFDDLCHVDSQSFPKTAEPCLVFSDHIACFSQWYISSHTANRYLKYVCVVGCVLFSLSYIAMRRTCPAGPQGPQPDYKSQPSYLPKYIAEIISSLHLWARNKCRGLYVKELL